VLELVGCAGGQEGVRRLALGAHQVAADQELVDVLGALLRTADEGHLVADDVGDHAGEQRVVGAAEDQGVDVCSDQRVEVVVRDREQLVTTGHPRLDEVDEPRAGASGERDVWRGGEGVVVGERLGGGVGADHPDPAVAGGGDGAARRGQDHLDDRYVVPLAGVAEHGGAGGVAGDHQGLDALVDEVVEALQCVFAHLADRLGPVRLAGRVTEVDDRLVGQLVDKRSGHGEPAEPRVEDADRRVGRRTGHKRTG